MLKATRWFVERLAERFVPLVGGMLAARVEAVYALGQAEEQSLLEDEARRYEAEGKPEIAAVLRRRAERLASDDPAGGATLISRHLSAGSGDDPFPAPPPLHLEGPTAESPRRPPRRKKSRRADVSEPSEAAELLPLDTHGDGATE